MIIEPRGELVALVKCLLIGKGNLMASAAFAESSNQPRRVVDVLKTAVASGSIADLNWGGSLVDYKIIASSFIEGLRNVSVFDRMLPDMKKLPLATRIVISTAVAGANTASEGTPRPVKKLSLAAGMLEPVQAAAIIVISQELAASAASGSQQLLSSELRAAVAAATDVAFINIVTDSIVAITSAGPDADDVRTDLAALLSAITIGANAKLYLLMTPEIAKALAVMSTATGDAAFEMTPTGGTICGLTALVSDEVADGTMILIDAAQIAVGDAGMTLDASNEATLEFNDAPDDPSTAGTVMQSLWQRNLTGLRAVRWFGAERLRASAVAVVEDVQYGEVGSP